LKPVLVTGQYLLFEDLLFLQEKPFSRPF